MEFRLKTNLLLVLLLLVNGGLGNAVQIPLTGLGDATATLLLVLLEDTNLLESLEDLAVDTTGGVNVVGGTRATVFRGAVDLSETTDTDGLAEVDVTGDSGGADVEPERHPLDNRTFFAEMIRGIYRTSQRSGEGARWKRRS